MSDADMPEGKKDRRSRWLRLSLIVAASWIVLIFLSGEIYMRIKLGMGDPPLFVSSPAMQYCYAPSQNCVRLGNHIHYNAYSMRSEDFPSHKSDPNELRIVMIGDSVINGGAHVDQSKLVSTVLREELATRLGRPVVVGNASAGGWGPPEELGWLQTFGTLDADIVVLVVSSHDYSDVPRWPFHWGLAAGYPTHKPLMAWQEFLSVYASRLIARPLNEGFVEASNPPQENINWCIWAIERMIQISHQNGARVIVAQHAERKELGGHWMPGHDINLASAAEGGADQIVQFEPHFLAACIAGGENPYRPNDPIHPDAVGHKIMADDLADAVVQVLQRSK